MAFSLNHAGTDMNNKFDWQFVGLLALANLILILLFGVPGHAQTLPGPPFSCQTTCTAASAATSTLPATPFTCQNMCSANPSFTTPTLPETPFTCNLSCAAPSTPATIPATPFTCQQVCSAPYTPVSAPPPGSPVVTPASFTVALPLVNDELIATLAVSNPPITGMAIVSGDSGNPTLNPSGYFNIWPTSLHLRLSDVGGAVLPPAGTYTLMINATNAAGTGSAAQVTVIVP